jgi:hypothetical protein
MIKTRIATDNPTLPMKVAAPFNRTCSKPLTYFKLQRYLKRVFTTKQKKVMKSDSEGSEISVIQKLQAHLVIQKLLVEESLLHCLH